MKKDLIKWMFLGVLLLPVKWGECQYSAIKTLLSADSSATGNTKDIFSNFYQWAVNDLTGPNKELKFTTNPYAIMLKANPALQDYNDYYRNRHWRRLNISVDAKFDSAYHFNGFASGITYAIVNQRDYTVSKDFVPAVKKDQYIPLHAVLIKEYVIQNADPLRKTQLPPNLFPQIDSLFNSHTLTFDQLPLAVRNWIYAINDPSIDFLKQEVKANSKLSVYNEVQTAYNHVVQSYANKHLLTASVSDTTAQTKFAFKNVQFSLESTRGFINPDAFFNIEWDVKASYIVADDTLSAGTNLKRQYLDLEPGLNIVLKKVNTQQSFLEFKASAEYQHIYKGQLYANESHDKFTLNGTLNLRLFNDIWIPLQFKWDPKTGNVFGFLNVTANFTGLASLVKGQTSKN